MPCLVRGVNSGGDAGRAEDCGVQVDGIVGTRTWNALSVLEFVVGVQHAVGVMPVSAGWASAAAPPGRGAGAVTPAGGARPTASRARWEARPVVPGGLAMAVPD